jgi:phosphoribosylformylglycinamidine (FGAM) synthase-like enzyme
MRTSDVLENAVMTRDSGAVTDLSCPFAHISLSANWMSASGHVGEDAKLFEAVTAVGMDLCPELGPTYW